MQNKPIVVLTRPAVRQQALIEALTRYGVPILALPALSIEPLMTPAVTAEIIKLNTKFYNLIIFVSRAAVEHFPADFHVDLGRSSMAAVGGQTAIAIKQRYGPLATVITPPKDTQQDSEALWQVLKPSLTESSQVLIVRAETGRNWLRDQFIKTGCKVDVIAVYARKPCAWSASQVQNLNTATSSKVPLIWLFTSAESVEAVALQFKVLGIQAAHAIHGVVATHPKVLERVCVLFKTVNFDALSTLKGGISTPCQVVAPCEQEILQGLMKLTSFLQT